MVSIRPRFPTVKHTPAKESKVHNVLIFASLGRFTHEGTWDSRSITVRALTLTLILFSQLFWGLSPPGTALSASKILPTKDLRDLLILHLLNISNLLTDVYLRLPLDLPTNLFFGKLLAEEAGPKLERQLREGGDIQTFAFCPRNFVY